MGGGLVINLQNLLENFRNFYGLQIESETPHSLDFQSGLSDVEEPLLVFRSMGGFIRFVISPHVEVTHVFLEQRVRVMR